MMAWGSMWGLRNTRVVDIVAELKEYGVQVDIYDPWVDKSEAEEEYQLAPIEQPEVGSYDGIILAVAHQQFKALGAEGIRQFCKPEAVLYDLKYVLKAEAVDLRL